MEVLWADAPRQACRAFRKKLGLPASSNVKILGELVKVLALVPQPSLPVVVISYPGIEALYNEDILDTVEYLSLRKLEGYYNYHPREIVAAYAGHGMGLCRNIQNNGEKSKNECSQLPVHYTLLVEYTQQALLLHKRPINTARDLGDNDFNAAASFELGSSSQMDKYAYHVAEFVGQFLREWYRFLNPEEILVIITGNIDDTIQEAIREVVD